MPYKDKEKQRAYKQKWRSQNKERYNLGQKLTSIRREIKEIAKNGINEENQGIYNFLLERFEKAQKEQLEFLELENKKTNLENELKRKIEQEIQKKEIEELRDKQEIIFQEQHEQRLQGKEELLKQIQKLEKKTYLDVQYKYTNNQLYYFANKNKKLSSSIPNSKQIFQNIKINNKKAIIKRRYKAMEYVWSYKLCHSCKDCGENHPAVLCFHHRDPKQKVCEIGKLVTRGRSIEIIQKEIDKCDVLCQNCHTLLHWKERFSMGE